jgi:Zn-finger nucleic acid-binding protein/ribosomal protein L40E
MIRPLSCRRCGGTFETSATHCPYCNGAIALEDRQLTSVCTACSARLASDARFCKACGTPAANQALAALPEDAACPRCRAALRVRHVGTRQLVECSSCGGFWLEPGLLESLCGSREEASAMLRAFTVGSAPQASVSETEVRYLPCVRCSEPMTRRNFGAASGVIIDVCKHHGCWLDHREIERILAWVGQGGLSRARQSEIERLERERNRVEVGTLDLESIAAPSTRRSRRHPLGVFDLIELLADVFARALK